MSSCVIVHTLHTPTPGASSIATCPTPCSPPIDCESRSSVNTASNSWLIESQSWYCITAACPTQASTDDTSTCNGQPPPMRLSQNCLLMPWYVTQRQHTKNVSAKAMSVDAIILDMSGEKSKTWQPKCDNHCINCMALHCIELTCMFGTSKQQWYNANNQRNQTQQTCQ